MQYRPSPDSGIYTFSYTETREVYDGLVALDDSEFIAHLPEAIHLACLIMWFKERGQSALSDRGIVHELVHLLQFGAEEFEKAGRKVSDLREQFKRDLELSR